MGHGEGAAERREAMQATAMRSVVGIKEDIESVGGRLLDIDIQLTHIAQRLDAIIVMMLALVCIAGAIAWKMWQP